MKIKFVISKGARGIPVFSPSYAYMELLWDEMSKINLTEFQLIKQKQI